MYGIDVIGMRRDVKNICFGISFSGVSGGFVSVTKGSVCSF